MGLNRGIVGLPNVEKSTLFQHSPVLRPTWRTIRFARSIRTSESSLFPIPALIGLQNRSPVKRRFQPPLNSSISPARSPARAGGRVGEPISGLDLEVGVIAHVVRQLRTATSSTSTATSIPSGISKQSTSIFLADLDTTKRYESKCPKGARFPKKRKNMLQRILPILERLLGDTGRGRKRPKLEA